MKGSLLALVATAVLAGCTVPAVKPEIAPEAGRSTEIITFLKEKKFPEGIAYCDKMAVEAAGTERGAQALFCSAQIRALYDNPARDYPTALQKFDEFLKQYPGNEKDQEAENWKYFIKTILDLKKENDHLTKNIERLKRVDIRHEERRTGK